MRWWRSNGPFDTLMILIFALHAISSAALRCRCAHSQRFASVTGASFTSSQQPSESMAMPVLTGAGLLCYAATRYLLHPAP